MQIDFHYLMKDDEYVGIALSTHGKINISLVLPEVTTSINNSFIILNYFHISQDGRRNGECWLKDIIIPHCQTNDSYLYVKSSHPKVFSLYNRLGKEVGSYQRR